MIHERGGIYRKEPDGSETLIGFARTWSEAQIIVDEDEKKVDYLYGYRWKMPEEEEERPGEAEADCTA